MGIFDELKRMAHPFEDEDDDFEEFEAAAPRSTERRDRRDRYEQPERLERAGRNESYGSVNSMEEERRSNKVVNIRAATQLQVVLVKPDKFDDASAIADHLREKRTVVLAFFSPTAGITETSAMGFTFQSAKAKSLLRVTPTGNCTMFWVSPSTLLSTEPPTVRL